MWLGSRSQMLRGHMRKARNPSVESLRALSMFKTDLGKHVHASSENESDGFYAAIPLHDLGSRVSDSRSLESLKFAASEDALLLNDVHEYNSRPHPPDTTCSRRWCYVLHIVFAALHVTLLALVVRHPEHSVVIPFDNSTLRVGLSAFLQAFYSLYSALLVIVTQRLALFKMVGERRKLIILHDVSGAWTGIGAAISILWEERQLPSSIKEIATVITYLVSMLVLHISSSSIMQWQAFNSMLVDILTSSLALPDGSVDVSKLNWVEIFPIARSISQDSEVSTYGLSNDTLYDVPQVPINASSLEASVNATTLDVQCGLVPNLTFSYQSSGGEYLINFSLNGTNNGNFLEPPIWKDVVHSIRVNECPPAVCPHALFYMITTNIDVSDSVHDTVCQPELDVHPASWGFPNLKNGDLHSGVFCQHKAASSSSAPWSVWSAGKATNISVGMATALTNDITGSLPMFIQGSSSAEFTDMDSYMMSLLGLDLASANASSATQSSANPSVTLSPSQLEEVVAQTAARFLWVAGQLGENGGGFQRAVGESQATRHILQWWLNINVVPVVFASIASFTALILVRFMIGKRPSKEHLPLISGTSVLECFWLEAQSETLHAHLEGIEEPHSDRLRAGGMFEITLGSIGRSGLATQDGNM